MRISSQTQTRPTPPTSLLRLGLVLGLLLGRAPLMQGQQPSTYPAGAPATRMAVAPGLTPATAPPLSLTAAMREADRGAFANRLAQAASDGDAARARQTLQGVLPAARIESGVVRTTDPIGAFGTMLRQRRVTAAAFDPARLNDPAAITNVQSGVVVEVPLLNADAWAGRRAATDAATAGRANGDWTARSTRSAVVRAYYGAVLATEQITTLQQAARAAEAARRQVLAMVSQGLVTKADALQASVRVSQVTAALLTAQNDAETAQRQLGVLLGRAGTLVPVVPTMLPSDSLVRALAVADTSVVEHGPTPRDGEHVSPRVDGRADVRAADAGLLAADANIQRAQRTMLPRLNGFARYDWNTPTALFAGQKNWTVGLMASWALFNGGGTIAEVGAARATASSARAGADALRAKAALEDDATRRAVIVALQRLDLATLAAEQSREAHRLVDKRYAGGLTTIAELLAAEASATGASLAQSASRFALIEAIAAHRLAIGGDPAALAQLDGTP